MAVLVAKPHDSRVGVHTTAVLDSQGSLPSIAHSDAARVPQRTIAADNCAAWLRPAQARLGLKKMDTLPERLELRRQRAGLLTSLLKKEIHPQKILEGAESTFYFYVALMPDPAAPIRQKLLLKGIDAGAGNEIMDNCAKQLGYDDCPSVNEIFDRALALPMFDGLSEKACEHVAKTLNRLV